MLDTLRDRNRNLLLQVFIYVMLGGVIVAMAIMFGPGSFGRTTGVTSPQHAATVNGEVITATEFGTAVENTLAQYRNFGLPVDDTRIAGIRRQTIDQLEVHQLVAQQAERHGIRIPDEELAKEIKDQLVPLWEDNYRDEFPSFRKFYERYVSSQGMTLGHFEEQMRKRLVYQRMLEALRTNVKVSPEEVERTYREENDKINLEFVRVSPIAFRKEVEPTPEQIQRKLEEDMEAVRRWYEENKFRYERPKRVRARHILVKPDGEDEAAGAAADEQGPHRCIGFQVGAQDAAADGDRSGPGPARPAQGLDLPLRALAQRQHRPRCQRHPRGGLGPPGLPGADAESPAHPLSPLPAGSEPAEPIPERPRRPGLGVRLEVHRRRCEGRLALRRGLLRVPRLECEPPNEAELALAPLAI